MPAKERVYEGDEAYFPDFGKTLKPGDEVPESAPDDPRFVAKAHRKPKAEEN